MRRHHSLLAATTSLLLLAAGAATAQQVYIFDDPPSLEQLRSIVIPESSGGMSRSIVMLKQDSAATTSPVQPIVSTTIATPPRPIQPVAAMPAAAMPVAAMPVAAPPGPVPPVAATTDDTTVEPTEPVARRRHMIHRAAAVSTASRPSPAAAAPEQPADKVPEAGVVGFRINFAFDSAALPVSGRGFVDRIAELMKDTPDLRLRVEGHTDSTGTPDYNLELSKRRALAVAEYLVDHGIAADRFVLVGKGMSEPLTEDAADPRNRRVQFVRVD
jgi:outer membrane protein OmpA-like peptidoglycan-associated protein